MASHPSVIRRFLLWWFAPPNSPWVSANVAIDFTAAQQYLDQLRDRPGEHVSVQHLLSGAVGRTLARFPDANARVIGGKIVHNDTVGVVAPVNLLGHEAGSTREVSFTVTQDVHQRALRDIAAQSRKAVRSERSGKLTTPVSRMVNRLLEGTPPAVADRGLDLMAKAMERRPFADRVYAMSPATTGLTNPGAAIRGQDGLLFRGGSLNLPNKLIHVGTLWGITPVQDEVIPVDGVPRVRPMLPVLFIFDHRLIDGVRASQVVRRFCEILQDPQAVFGENGQQEGPPVRAPR